MLKKILLYLILFILSFTFTLIAISQGIKNANKKAHNYIANFSVKTSNLPDGTYHGKYKYVFFTLAQIEFKIEHGLAKTVQIKKLYQTPGSLYKSEIEKKLSDSKTIELDAVSGATRTSNFTKAAIKNAVENVKIKSANSI